MGNFSDLKIAVQKQFRKMEKCDYLFKTNIDKDTLWYTYLNSFPEGTNKIYRERTEYDCQCCKQFIRACGNVVAIIDNKLVSIWDIKVDGYYQIVANALSKLVKSKAIKDLFLYSDKKIGTNFNHQLTESGDTIKWEHFYLELPSKFVETEDRLGKILSDHRNNKGVIKRGLDEISIDACDTVLELIDQNSLYRGEEHLKTVEFFKEMKNEYDLLKNNKERDNFCWDRSKYPGTRNTVIGTLLVDISNDVDLTQAVKMFEAKVAPENYKRPTAVITKSMIANAQKKVEELGIESALSRRFAKTEDITVNNILFANRDTKKAMNVFDEMAKEVPENVKKFKKVEEVGVKDFIENILPKAENIEVMVENKHTNNFMSLIAPVYTGDVAPIFKWHNNFSWAYNGEVADSMRERVKNAGGCVDGVLRCSLSWFNYDDLDIHVIEPNKNHIYYQNAKRIHPSSGVLDVDMNVQPNGSRKAVENIVWTNKSKMQNGIYEVFINNYTLRESIDIGFDAEIEYNGEIHSFHYPQKVGKKVQVAKFEFNKETGIKFIKSLPSTTLSKDIWGISTNKFHKVNMVMNSPNHWDDKTTGNKHYFFILEDCKNDGQPRGFFNEFLSEDLKKHRKVFEVLGSKMKVEKSDNQLSGLGFSSTQKNSILCRVTGSFTRTIKIVF